MQTSSLYWIRKLHHTDITKEGYVGVARDFSGRIYRHKNAAKKGQHQNNLLQEVLLQDDTIVEVIFFGDEKDCYEKEYELRPFFNLGWNIAPGGKGGSRPGTKLSEEFCKRRSELMKGNTLAKGNHKPKSEEHRKKIGLSNKGRPKSEEQKRKQSLIMKGRKQSPESNEKRRIASTGRKYPNRKKKNEQLVL
jgi:hypothetical protein